MVESHQISQVAAGKWPHASAFLIPEDVWPSHVVCVRLDFFRLLATSLFFFLAFEPSRCCLLLDRSWLLDRRAQLRDDSSTSEEKKETISNESQLKLLVFINVRPLCCVQLLNVLDCSIAVITQRENYSRRYAEQRFRNGKFKGKPKAEY